MKNINSLVKEVNLLKKKYFSEIPHIDQEISKIFEKVNFGKALKLTLLSHAGTGL